MNKVKNFIKTHKGEIIVVLAGTVSGWAIGTLVYAGARRGIKDGLADMKLEIELLPEGFEKLNTNE